MDRLDGDGPDTSSAPGVVGVVAVVEGNPALRHGDETRREVDVGQRSPNTSARVSSVGTEGLVAWTVLAVQTP